jgi:hypothetical protein
MMFSDSNLTTEEVSALGDQRRLRCRLPEWDDQAEPAARIPAAAIALILLCGNVDLQREWTKVIAGQSADRELALLQIGRNRTRKVGKAVGHRSEQGRVEEACLIRSVADASSITGVTVKNCTLAPSNVRGVDQLAMGIVMPRQLAGVEFRQPRSAVLRKYRPSGIGAPTAMPTVSPGCVTDRRRPRGFPSTSTARWLLLFIPTSHEGEEDENSRQQHRARIRR